MSGEGIPRGERPRAWKRAALEALRAAGSAIFEADCPVCREPMGWGRDGACERCWNEVLPRREVTSGKARSGPLGAVVSWGRHEGRLRDFVHALKFRSCPLLARPLGAWVARAILDSGWLDRGVAPVLVPVPLSPGRRWSRGYDQAELLAVAAARALRREAGLALEVARPIRRRIGTPLQAGRTREERLGNLAGAFAPALLGSAAVAGRWVVLIDDVTTTGATLEACALALREAGAEAAAGAVLARTPEPRKARIAP